jgi:hypothetical protein
LLFARSNRDNGRQESRIETRANFNETQGSLVASDKVNLAVPATKISLDDFEIALLQVGCG